jgi:uncharacterized protein YbbC (DUF1343 family)
MSFQRVQTGVEVFLEDFLDSVQNKKVGLITNPTGVNSQLTSTVELFFNHNGIDLVALYGPEHGVRGEAQAGEYVPFFIDKKLNIPVFSLYGQSRKPDPGKLHNIDEYMRTFDTQDNGKYPEKEMVGNLDVMIFDVQDVGTRIYTYISTMAYSMLSCARAGIDFIVLDRPNPLNGVNMEGPLLEYPEFSSFVGLYPIPVRHGMTVGELAGLFNDKYLEQKVSLKVIPMLGWQREMWFDDTHLPWILPSPNIPDLSTAIVYPGQVLLEGTNISEGRGTTKPFVLFGAPWIDGYDLSKKLNGLKLPGVKFMEAWFRPNFSKFSGQLCGGCQMFVEDRNVFEPFASSLHIIDVIRTGYQRNFLFYPEYFDKTTGTSRVRESLERGDPVEKITKSCLRDVEQFAVERKPYLLY